MFLSNLEECVWMAGCSQSPPIRGAPACDLHPSGLLCVCVCARAHAGTRELMRAPHPHPLVPQTAPDQWVSAPEKPAQRVQFPAMAGGACPPAPTPHLPRTLSCLESKSQMNGLMPPLLVVQCRELRSGTRQLSEAAVEGGTASHSVRWKLKVARQVRRVGLGVGSGLLKPGVCRVRVPLGSPLGCPRPVPGFPPVVLPRGDQSGVEIFSPGETVLDQVAVPARWPGSQGA